MDILLVTSPSTVLVKNVEISLTHLLKYPRFAAIFIYENVAIYHLYTFKHLSGRSCTTEIAQY